MDTISKSQAFKLKGRLYTFAVLQLLHTDPTSLEVQLEEAIAKAPKLFDNTPIVMDFSLVEQEQVDFNVFCEILHRHKLLLVGIQGASLDSELLAQAKGIAVLHATASHDKLMLDDTVEKTTSKPECTTKLVTTPVRSGQQVVNKEGDLIITASVSPGAELLANGNIHVYGTLRGRALAGISGNQQARIFCQALEAELVSIAGCYRLRDAIEPITSACQIYLLGEHIHIETL